MARKSDIRYIQFYTDGSAAKQVATRQPRWKMPAPKANRQKRIVLRVDPLALCGIVVAAVMFILMAVGMFRLHEAQQDAAAMEAYVRTLEAENTRLSQEYAEQCDLEEIEKTALALGMVSADQVAQVPIRVEVPRQEAPVSVWEKITAFFSGLFA